MMLKNIFNKLSKRFLCQSGEIILTTLVITGLVSLGVSLYALGKKSEELKKDLPAWEYADQQDTPDAVNLGKLSDEQKAAFVKFAIEAGETAVGSADDTGFLGILQYFGIFKGKDSAKKPEKDVKEEEDIKTQLQANKLPADNLMVDTAKVIKKQIIKKASEDISKEDIDKLLFDTLSIVQNEVDEAAMQADNEEMLDAIETIEIIDAIEQSLKDDEKLEKSEIINLKNEISKLKSEKKYLEEKIESYKYYEEKGYIVTDTSGLGNIEERLDDINNKIMQKTSQVEKMLIENEKAENQTEDTVIEKNAPSIELVITEGPKFSEKDKVCYYKVTAKTTGNPEPQITFSRDDSNGAWGSKTAQINLKDGGSYNLKATAANSEGSVTDSINLTWGCEVQDSTTVTSTDNNQSAEIKAPTIKISVIDLDTTSSPWIAIYTVQAVVTGEPFPTIGWSTGSYDQGKDTVEVYVKSYSSNNGTVDVTAWATNSEGMAQDSLTLVWEDVWTEKGY